jgi:hypothetical protein
MKRRISLLLAVVMILGSFSFVFAANDEVEPGKFLEEKGVLKGDTTGDLMLDKPLERRDSVILLSRLLGVEKDAKAFEEEGLPTWEDNNDGNYKGYLAWAQSNKYFQGHSEAKFGPRENITVKEYAVVLLRALGYYDEAADWKAVFETAKKLGVLEEVKKEADEEVLRGEMAQMTFNALGLKVKGEDKTLAEKLGIEMPAPKELKAEVKDTENLKEIVVNLSNAKLADKDKLEDAGSYKLTGNVIEKAELKDNDVILLLRDALVKGREYELLIRGMGKELNGKYKFVARDNTIPAVEKVEALGEYGIKVTTTEPIDDARERNFLIDGKNVAMKIEQYGRDIILTPYYKSAFSDKTEKLTIKELKDFAGYKSAQEDFEVEIVKDEVAPKVVDVISKGNKVEVIFDKDIYNDSVDAYYSRTSTGNISYESGRHTVYAEDAKKIDTNRVVYTFKDEVSKRTVVTIVDVQNHSKVAMEKTTMEVREVLDNVEPEIIDKKVSTDPDGTATIKLYFDKDVTGSFKVKDESFKVEDHFTLYEREVLKRNILEGKIDSAEYEEDRKDVVVVELSYLEVNNKDKDHDYILEVVDFADASSSRNKMYRDYVDFEVKAAKSDFAVDDVIVKERTSETEITILFNKSVDRVIAEDPTNYIFKDNKDKRHDVKDLEGEVITEKNGKEVTLIIPDFDSDDYKELRILDVLKDKDGNRLNKETIYTFNENLPALVAKAEKLEKDAKALLPEDETKDTKNEAALREAYKELTKTQVKDSYVEANHDKLVKAIEKVEKAIDKVKEDNKGNVSAEKKVLRRRIDEAQKVYDKLTDKNTVVAKNLAAAIKTAEFVLDSDKATVKDVTDTMTALETAKNAAETGKTSVADVEKLINELPAVDKLTIEDEAKVNKAKADFDALGDLKNSVNKDLAAKLDKVVEEMTTIVADNDAVTEELNKVGNLKVAVGTTVNAELVKEEVEKIVSAEVKVGVKESGDNIFTVTIAKGKASKSKSILVTFEAPEVEKYTLTLTGEGLTSNPDASEIEEGKEVVVTVKVPTGKTGIDTFMVNGVDKKAELSGEGTYTFTITGNTAIEVTYKAN